MAEQTKRAGLKIFRAAEARPFDEELASKVFRGPVMDGAAMDALPRWDSAAGAGDEVDLWRPRPRRDEPDGLMVRFKLCSAAPCP